MNLSRRSLAGYAGALLASTALAACTTPQQASATVVVSSIEGYVQDVINGVTALTASASITSLLTPTEVSAVNGAVSDATTVLADIKAAASTVILTTAQGWAAQVEGDVNTVVGLLALVPGIPSAASTIIEAINVLLPILLTSVQLAVPAKASQSGMTPSQAHVILTNPKV
jgi:hypothetical protein